MQTTGPSLPDMLTVHIETEIKPIFISIQSICGLDSRMKVQYQFTYCIEVLLLDMSYQFMNRICSTLVQLQ